LHPASLPDARALLDNAATIADGGAMWLTSDRLCRHAEAVRRRAARLRAAARQARTLRRLPNP